MQISAARKIDREQGGVHPITDMSASETFSNALQRINTHANASFHEKHGESASNSNDENDVYELNPYERTLKQRIFEHLENGEIGEALRMMHMAIELFDDPEDQKRMASILLEALIERDYLDVADYLSYDLQEKGFGLKAYTNEIDTTYLTRKVSLRNHDTSGSGFDLAGGFSIVNSTDPGLEELSNSFGPIEPIVAASDRKNNRYQREAIELTPQTPTWDQSIAP